MSIFGKAKDLILGKKKGYETIPEDAATTQMRSQGMQSLQDARNMLMNQGSVEDQALSSQQSELGQAAGSLGDVRRRVQQQMAQRGIQNSSVGIGAQIGAEREVQNRMADINASLPERIRALREQRAAQLSDIGGKMTGLAGKQDIVQTGGGGLLPGLLAIGGGIAGSAGGPMGAMAGAQLGGSLGGAVANKR